MPLPTFMIIGGQKAGTSALWAVLSQHPGIFMSKLKEPMYYCVRGWPEGPPLLRQSVSDPAQYQALFEQAAKGQAIGEASTWYLPCPWVAARLRQELPDVKLIAVLRQPVERAFSQYLMHVREGKRSLERIEQDIWHSEARVMGEHVWTFGYVPLGLYAQQLQVYWSLFPREQIRVYLYDDYRDRPLEVARDIFRFLGVDEGFTPNIAVRMNEASVSVPARTLSGWLFNPGSPVSRLADRLLPVGLSRSYVQYSRSKLVRPQLCRRLRARLLERFRDDITELARMLGRNLSAWMQ